MMQNERVFRVLDLCSYVLLLINIVAVPLFISKSLVNFYIIPKQYVFIGLILVNLLLYAAKLILSKRLTYTKSFLDIPFLGFLGVLLLSSIFSVNATDSFFGRSEYFVMNFFFLLFLVIFYLAINNTVKTFRGWMGMIDTIIYTGGLTALVFLLKVIFKLDLLNYIIPGVWNTIDKINTPFGFWLIVIFVLSAGQLIKRNINLGKALSYFFVTLLSFVCLIMLSFNILWWIFLVGLVLLLLVGVSFVNEVRVGWVSTLFAFLVMVVIFLAFGSPKYLQTQVPAEVALGYKPSWVISYKTVLSGVKDFALGSGIGTFNVDFSRFRSADFNNDAWAWSLRFSQPFSTLYAIFAETGVLGLLTFVFLLLYILGHVFSLWIRNKAENFLDRFSGEGEEFNKIDFFLIVAAWLVLTVAMAFSFHGPVLWWLWFLLLGLMTVGLSFVNSQVLQEYDWEITENPQYSLSFSFLLIVIMAGITMVGVVGARMYVAESVYAQALNSKNYQEAQANLTKALGQRPNSDLYHAALAQVYLMQAVTMASTPNPDMQTISGYVAVAVNEAKKATEISPRSVAIWENLAIMYENAASLVPEAREWAIKSWQQAKDLEPTNPVLSWRLGNNYLLAQKNEEAIKSYKEAVFLKGDYLDAHMSLAQVYESENKIDEAVEVYKTAFNLGSSNATYLFDFGRVLYNRDKDQDRSDAEKLWLAAVKIQPNYSNALYSLGLLYESKGDKTTALQYYYKVKDLNPDNKDIITKIKSLVGVPKTVEAE